MNRDELGLETEAFALDCSIETWCQRRRKCKPLEKEHQCGWESCVPLAALCVRHVISESRSSEVERKVGGKFHLKLNISLKPIANKYHEGKMKRTLKRELKVFEIAERKAKRTSFCFWDWHLHLHKLFLNAKVTYCAKLWKALVHDALLLGKFLYWKWLSFV